MSEARARIRQKRKPSRLAAERKRDLIEAAIRDITAHGYDAVTVTTICEEAGFSRGLIGHYFSGKEEILFGMHEVFIDLLLEKAQAWPLSMSAQDALRQVMKDIFDVMHTHRGYVRVSSSTFASFRPNPSTALARSAIFTRGRLGRSLNAASPMARSETSILGLSLLGSSARATGRINDIATPVPAVRRELSNFFSDLFFNGLKERQ